jgi:hypothetical protein
MTTKQQHEGPATPCVRRAGSYSCESSWHWRLACSSRNATHVETPWGRPWWDSQVRCRTPSKASHAWHLCPSWECKLAGSVPCGSPHSGTTQRGPHEATKNMVTSSMKQSTATPEGKGRLDDVIQLFDGEGPWVANQATIAPLLEWNQHFRLKTAWFGGGT